MYLTMSYAKKNLVTSNTESTIGEQPGNPPEMPQNGKGENSSNAENNNSQNSNSDKKEPPQKSDESQSNNQVNANTSNESNNDKSGDNQNNKQTSPQKPDESNQSGNSSNMSTPPEKPDGDNNSQGDNQSGKMQPPSNNGMPNDGNMPGENGQENKVTAKLTTKFYVIFSVLTMNLQETSEYTGTINADNSAKSVSLKLDATSKITLTGDSYVTSLEDTDTSYSNINFNGYKLYVNGNAIN